MSMYEDYTRQSLAEKEYRELLGTAIYVFNSNNGFLIENILRADENNKYDWYELIDKMGGDLKKIVTKTIINESEKQNKKKLGKDIEEIFSSLVETRNRIIHSFAITDPLGVQILRTKEKKTHTQFTITTELLMKFIKDNEKLALKLHEFRGC